MSLLVVLAVRQDFLLLYARLSGDLVLSGAKLHGPVAKTRDHIISNELIGFPNYQGQTELARLMFVITGTEWIDTISR